jgi:hypothetical protein
MPREIPDQAKIADFAAGLGFGCLNGCNGFGHAPRLAALQVRLNPQRNGINCALHNATDAA